jgi:hypothetical protein
MELLMSLCGAYCKALSSQGKETDHCGDPDGRAGACRLWSGNNAFNQLDPLKIAVI